jgi:hypothetical protein
MRERFCAEHGHITLAHLLSTGGAVPLCRYDDGTTNNGASPVFTVLFCMMLGKDLTTVPQLADKRYVDPFFGRYCKSLRTHSEL